MAIKKQGDGNLSSGIIRSQASLADLQEAAYAMRVHVITQSRALGQAYVGQGLQAAELFSALFWSEMDWSPNRLRNQDHFLLSVGHYAIAFYAMLSAKGHLSAEELLSYGADGTHLTLAGEPGEIPGMEFAGGSLGQGLGVACGLAYGNRLQSIGNTVYVYLSDGEMQEGAIWEAAMFAGARNLGNVVAVVDINRTQADGDLVLEIEPLTDKFRAFGWHAVDVDGHSLPQILDAFAAAREHPDQPSVIVAQTRLAEGSPTLQARPNAHFVRVEDELWDRVTTEVHAHHGRTN